MDGSNDKRCIASVSTIFVACTSLVLLLASCASTPASPPPKVMAEACNDPVDAQPPDPGERPDLSGVISIKFSFSEDRQHFEFTLSNGTREAVTVDTGFFHAHLDEIACFYQDLEPGEDFLLGDDAREWSEGDIVSFPGRGRWFMINGGRRSTIAVEAGTTWHDTWNFQWFVEIMKKRRAANYRFYLTNRHIGSDGIIHKSNVVVIEGLK